MNGMAIIDSGSAASVTSAWIAELVGKRHDNVKRTIETLVGQGVIAQPQIEDVHETGGNSRVYVTQVYRFVGDRGKRDSIVVVAQLSPEFTARLVDRWQELEAMARQPALPDFTDPAVAAVAWAEQYRAKQIAEQNAVALEYQVAEQAPKVAALERIAEAEGSLCLRDAAKALQVRPIALRNLLLAQRWIYGRPGHSGWLAYQDRIQQGLLTHKVTTVARLDGSDKVVEQVRITPKGITRLAQMLQKEAA